ncbi:hypothetical protein OH77DRAFT_908485 [Trametes cingulata]|nr:hypothetical protein OH77DRAFT_908485 [Trametes cingulata]
MAGAASLGGGSAGREIGARPIDAFPDFRAFPSSVQSTPPPHPPRPLGGISYCTSGAGLSQLVSGAQNLKRSIMHTSQAPPPARPITTGSRCLPKQHLCTLDRPYTWQRPPPAPPHTGQAICKGERTDGVTGLTTAQRVWEEQIGAGTVKASLSLLVLHVR